MQREARDSLIIMVSVYNQQQSLSRQGQGMMIEQMQNISANYTERKGIWTNRIARFTPRII